MTNNGILEIPQLHVDAEGERVLAASASSSKNDVDFFEGKWPLRNKKN